MNSRSKFAIVPAIIALLLAVAVTAPAHAAACHYGIWQDGKGMIGIDASGHAAKKTWACNRARRKCKRKLDRARRNGRLPRGASSRDIRCKRYG